MAGPARRPGAGPRRMRAGQSAKRSARGLQASAAARPLPMLGRRRPHHSPSARGPARKRRPARKRNNPSHIRQPEQPGNVTDMIRIIGSAPAAGRRGGGMEVYSIISGGLTGGRRPGVCARGSPAQRGLGSAASARGSAWRGVRPPASKSSAGLGGAGPLWLRASGRLRASSFARLRSLRHWTAAEARIHPVRAR